jgi:hypothetical protein
MWSSSTHIQGHRGRIESTGITSPSTALAPPSLSFPFHLQGSRLYRVKPQKGFTLSHTPYPPRFPIHWYRYCRCVWGEIPTLFREGVLSAPSVILLGVLGLQYLCRCASAVVPATPLAVIVRACVRCVCTYPHAPFSRMGGGLHVSVPISRPIVYRCSLARD